MKTADQLVRERLQLLCQAKGCTLTKLAKISGLSHASITGFISGRYNNIGILTLQKVCNGLGISLYEFFNAELFKIKE